MHLLAATYGQVRGRFFRLWAGVAEQRLDTARRARRGALRGRVAGGLRDDPGGGGRVRPASQQPRLIELVRDGSVGIQLVRPVPFLDRLLAQQGGRNGVRAPVRDRRLPAGHTAGRDAVACLAGCRGLYMVSFVGAVYASRFQLSFGKLSAKRSNSPRDSRPQTYQHPPAPAGVITAALPSGSRPIQTAG